MEYDVGTFGLEFLNVASGNIEVPLLERCFEELKQVAEENPSRLVCLPGLEKDVALALVSDEACRRGAYVPSVPFSPICPGVLPDEGSSYSVYVVNPLRIGGDLDA
jgi:hypothetical protein